MERTLFTGHFSTLWMGIDQQWEVGSAISAGNNLPTQWPCLFRRIWTRRCIRETETVSFISIIVI